ERQAARDLVATPAEHILVLHRRIRDVPRLPGELTHSQYRLPGGLGERREHAPLLLGHDEDRVGAREEVTLRLQVRRTRARRQLDADLAENEPGIERDEAAVARERRDAARADVDTVGKAALGEHAQQDLLGDDAAAR